MVITCKHGLVTNTGWTSHGLGILRTCQVTDQSTCGLVNSWMTLVTDNDTTFSWLSFFIISNITIILPSIRLLPSIRHHLTYDDCLENKTVVSWSLTSLFSTNMAISETKGQGWKVIRTQ